MKREPTMHTVEALQYLLLLPDAYRVGEKYPLLFFFHGAGSRGQDIEELKKNPFFAETGKPADLPFIVAAPLCHGDTWFDIYEQLSAFLFKVAARADVDTDRIYAMGASMGGYATWHVGMSFPDLFAAIVPICGGGMYWNAGRLKNTPVWAFHGEKDTVVFPEESRKMVDAVKARGGDARLTVYPENGHDAWSDTYRNPEVFTWLLSHRKETEKEPDTPLKEHIYG